MATLLWMGVWLLLAVVVGRSVRSCHAGCHCEVESFGLFDSFSLTRVDCSRLGLGTTSKPVPIPLDTSHLDLSSNAIQALSATMLSGPGYTTLASLDLSDNLIASITADTFSRLRYLETLDLSRNMLEFLEDGCFTGLPLTEVDLSGNRITELRLNVFSSQGQGGRPLSVDVSENQITVVTRGSSGGLPALQSLTLARNRLAEVPESLRGLGLQYLNIDANPIVEIREGAFAGLGELVHLSLAGLRELTVVQPGAFWNLRSLQVLDLSNAPQLMALDSGVLGGLVSLQELNLSGSGVATLPKNILAHLPSLGSVTLGANVHCWRTSKQTQFHPQLSQAKSELMLTCDIATVVL